MSQHVFSLQRRQTPTFYRLLPSGRSLAIAAALVAGAGGLYAIARETTMFAVRTIEVEGATPAVARQVQAALGRLSGTNLLALDGAAVIRTVDDLPTVVSASYDRDFPHTLRVRVLPESPVAVLRRGSGAWLASARGRVITPVARSRYRSLPRIWLPATTEIELGGFLTGDAAASARALRTVAVARFAGRVLWARVQDGQLTLALRSGLQLEFGAPTWLALKIAVVRSVLPTLSPPSAGGPTYLDVSVPERPVAGTNSQPAG
ncbi:MAG TPA: FtsQ-type POTRA domain-containing protein [Gaiellaceae bacterium]|nr:FtsQ-type POTRA domain-containing protein [Gaiellaceae bacterium]